MQTTITNVSPFSNDGARWRATCITIESTTSVRLYALRSLFESAIVCLPFAFALDLFSFSRGYLNLAEVFLDNSLDLNKLNKIIKK